MLIRRQGIAAALVATVLTLSATAVTADAKTRDCGTISRGDKTVRVKVTRGPVGCKEARKIIRAIADGAGPKVGKWTCQASPRAVGCVKSKPKARITAILV